jgi:hypothetical protein
MRWDELSDIRTLFSNETVVTIIRVVGVSETAMRVFKLQELVAMLARVSGARKSRFQ